MIRLGNFLETLCFIVLGWTHFPSWQIVTGVLIMFVVRYSNWTKFVTGLMYLPAIFIIKKEIYNSLCSEKNKIKFNEVNGFGSSK
jgi:hypothetical protein